MKKIVGILLGLVLVILIGQFLIVELGLIKEIEYSASQLQIEEITSPVDFDQDGIDDFHDFVLGAKKDADNHPRYDGSYVDGGYPSDEVGVCTDVIWRAFKEAGYNLKEMVDLDISLFPQDYPNVTIPDPNIDFRRVSNLHVFFEKYGQELPLDLDDVTQWQPGDIVIFKGDKHIGLVSDKRTKEGVPFIYHNAGQVNRHENYLKRAKVIGHYRFDVSLIDKSVLILW